ncbi:MAG: zinc ribbon domain-containing protein [Actinobacteria bacterium]|nr:zinc ribbon domain-containing protein [Actinomycetota bacterium]
MFCEKCGKEIADDSLFCGYCGATVSSASAGTGQEGQPPVPPDHQVYVPPSPPAGVPPAGLPQGPAPQATPYAPTPKKSPLPWVMGGIGVLAAIAVVLVLVFVVFAGNGTGDTSGPEEVVRKFYRAMETQDADLFLEIIEPSFRAELEDALGKNYRTFFEDYFFQDFPEDLEVEIREMETEIRGDTATVTIVDGTMTYTDEYGDVVTEEASEDDVEPVRLVRVDGEWYLSGDYLRESVIDPHVLEGLSLDEPDRNGTTDNGDSGVSEDEGYDEAEKLAEVEAAMLAYTKANAAAGLDFEIFNLFIKGNEAVGLALCTNQDIDAPMVIMKRDARGWHGVDVGTDLELPAWYESRLTEVEAAMLAYTKANAAAGLEFEISGLLIKGNEAVGVALCTNQDIDAPLVIMKRDARGWHGVDLGTGIEPPPWYPCY